MEELVKYCFKVFTPLLISLYSITIDCIAEQVTSEISDPAWGWKIFSCQGQVNVTTQQQQKHSLKPQFDLEDLIVFFLNWYLDIRGLRAYHLLHTTCSFPFMSTDGHRIQSGD